MKCKSKWTLLTGVVLAGLVLAGTMVVGAFQASLMARDVVGSGGGHLEQGSVSLDCTLGQPVAGLLSSGEVELCTGFWCGSAMTEYQLYLPLVLKGT